MVKGKTKSGIQFDMDERIKEDTRLYQFVVEMQNTNDPMSQGRALFDLLSLMFGGRDGVLAFQNAVASAHDGVCTNDAMMSELNDIIEALNAKKS